MKPSSQGRVLSIDPKVETDPRKGWKWNIFHFFFVKRNVNKIEKSGFCAVQRLSSSVELELGIQPSYLLAIHLHNIYGMLFKKQWEN